MNDFFRRLSLRFRVGKPPLRLRNVLVPPRNGPLKLADHHDGLPLFLLRAIKRRVDRGIVHRTRKRRNDSRSASRQFFLMNVFFGFLEKIPSNGIASFPCGFAVGRLDTLRDIIRRLLGSRLFRAQEITLLRNRRRLEIIGDVFAHSRKRQSSSGTKRHKQEQHGANRKQRSAHTGFFDLMHSVHISP